MQNCFIIMPVTTPPSRVDEYGGDTEHFAHVLEHLFCPAVEAAGYKPVRPVAEGAEIIHARTIENLSNADLVLCDMSSLNPNVFFEFGIRVALDRPVCVVQDDVTGKIPFDASVINCYQYASNLSPWFLESQIPGLTKHIQRSGSDAGRTRSLWQYFGLSARAHLSSQASSEEDDKLAYLTIQMEAIRRQMDTLSQPPSAPKAFGERLRAVRVDHNLSQTELGDRVGISQVYVSKIERGEAQPSKEVEDRIRLVLGDSLGEV